MTTRLTPATATALEALTAEATAIEQVVERVRDSLPAALELLASARGRVIVSGIGKSGHVGAKMAATFASTGTPAQFIHSAEALHGDSGMAVPGDVAILISHSGRTAEVCQFARMLKARAIPVIAMAGPADSPLARIADVHLSIAVAREADPLNLAPTASTTCALAIGDALASGLMTLGGFTPEDFAVFHPGGSLGEQLLDAEEGAR